MFLSIKVLFLFFIFSHLYTLNLPTENILLASDFAHSVSTNFITRLCKSIEYVISSIYLVFVCCSRAFTITPVFPSNSCIHITPLFPYYLRIFPKCFYQSKCSFFFSSLAIYTRLIKTYSEQGEL